MVFVWKFDMGVYSIAPEKDAQYWAEEEPKTIFFFAELAPVEI